MTDMKVFNLQEIIESFDNRWSCDKEKFIKGLRFRDAFEQALPESLVNGTHKVGDHPLGYEIWLWEGSLLSTKIHPRAVYQKCHGRRLLEKHGEWRSFWFCLDCNKNVYPVDDQTFLRDPSFE